MSSKAGESSAAAIPQHNDGPDERSFYDKNFDMNNQVGLHTSCDEIPLTDYAPT